MITVIKIQFLQDFNYPFEICIIYFCLEKQLDARSMLTTTRTIWKNLC